MKTQIYSLGLATGLLSTSVLGQDYLVASNYHALSRRQQSVTKNITVLHINDVHARLDQFRSSGVDCPARNATSNVTVPCYGGYARVLAKAKEIRAAVPNSLFLNAGDEFQGTAFYSYYGGEKIAQTLNQMNMTAFTLGNHEFDAGDDVLAAFLKNLTMPTISTNVKSNNTALQSSLREFLVIPEHNLGIVAITTNTTPGISSPGKGTTFGDYGVVQTTADALLQSRLGPGNGIVKRIIALTHIGYQDDIALVRSTRNIAMIVGGHSHSRLGNDSAAEGQYPTIVKNLDGQDVFVVTAWRWGQQLGRMDVEFSETTGQILRYTGAPINMTDDLPQDQNLQQQITQWREPFDQFNQEIVGQTLNDLDQTTCQQRECTLGNAVTDSMLWFRRNVGANVSFAIHNAGGIRASIDAPAVSRGEIATSFPFGNQLVDVQFTGRQLFDIFEGIVSRLNSAGKVVTSNVQISDGCRFTYNPSNPTGSRLISLFIENKDVDFSRTYTITTLDFIATGGDFFFPNAPSTPGATLGSQSEAFTAWTQRFSPLNVTIQNRMVITNETRPQHSLNATA